MLELSAASAEMDSLFVRCREESGYQRQLALLLAEVFLRPAGPATVSLHLLALSENFWYLYYVANRLYCAREFYVESCVCEHQKILGC